MEKSAARVFPMGVAFEPDVLISHLYFKVFRTRSHFSSEQGLMFAVLTDAVECYQKHVGAKTRARRKLFSEANDWIASPESSWPFSFEYICETLNLDPSYLRIGLTRWRHDHELRKSSHRRVRESLRYRNRVKYNRLYSSKRRDAPLAL